KVDIGYLHRSFEKFAETWQFPQLAPFVDRNDYLAGTLNEQAYCLAVERLLGLEVPERAEYIRVIMAELNRIGSHLIWFGTFAMDLGATTAFLWAFAARERLYDLNEVVTGGRMFPQLFRLGGVRNDFPPACFPMDENGRENASRRSRLIPDPPARRAAKCGPSGPRPCGCAGTGRPAPPCQRRSPPARSRPSRSGPTW